MNEPTWAVTEPVNVTLTKDYDGGERLLVVDDGLRWATMLVLDSEGHLTANGEPLDSSRDYPRYLGLFEEGRMAGPGEVYVDPEGASVV